VAKLVLRLDALTIEEKPLQDIPAEVAQAAMLQGVRELGIAALPWDREARDLQARIEFLRRLHPKDDWPAVADRNGDPLRGHATAPRSPAQDRAQKFIDAHVAKLRPLAIRAGRAWWDANVSGKDEDLQRKEEAQNHIDEALADPELLKESGRVLFHTVLMLLAFFFLLVDGPRLIRWLWNVSPLEARQTEELFARQSALVPLRHGATPVEVGRAVLAILALPSMTGQMLALDGGPHLQWSAPASRQPPEE